MSKSEILESIILAHQDREGSLLPILHDIQAVFGCIGDGAKRHVAGALNLTPAEVHGVVSFYHDFKDKAASLPVLKLCRAESCQARGCEALAAEITDVAKGKVEIETVYCLGFCSVGPAAMVNGNVHARLDNNKLAQLIEALR